MSHKNPTRTIFSTIVAISVATGMAVCIATPAAAAVCGFSGVTTPGIGGNVAPWEEEIYNHCGKGNVKIRVQYYYAEQDFCVTPGETKLYANPYLGAVKFAYYIGAC